MLEIYLIIHFGSKIANACREKGIPIKGRRAKFILSYAATEIVSVFLLLILLPYSMYYLAYILGLGFAIGVGVLVYRAMMNDINGYQEFKPEDKPLDLEPIEPVQNNQAVSDSPDEPPNDQLPLDPPDQL